MGRIFINKQNISKVIYHEDVTAELDTQSTLLDDLALQISLLPVINT